jgi:UDP-N-acetylglucosamine 2-epimerase (non-hydrolysing)
LINCFVGTRAQLIKMAPVILEMENRGVPLRLVFTGQHEETMARLLEDFGIRTAPRHLYQGREVTGVLQMGVWFLRSLWKCLRRPDDFLARGKKGRDVVVVHGDTFSTLLGALAGAWLGMRVAHVEAGLRSHNLLHPFPEELTRLAVARLADLAFCPGAWACGNLAGRAVRRVDTGQNTLAESLAHALAAREGEARETLPEDFGVVSLHRFENVFRRRRLAHIVRLIELAAERHALVFVLHPATRNKLGRFGLLKKLEENPRIALTPRMGYVEFVRLLARARFVITDGGGNQEELSYLGIPTLLMRKATERTEGMASTARLCAYDAAVLEEFLAHLPAHRRAPEIPPAGPSRLIVDALSPYAD